MLLDLRQGGIEGGMWTAFHPCHCRQRVSLWVNGELVRRSLRDSSRRAAEQIDQLPRHSVIELLHA